MVEVGGRVCVRSWKVLVFLGPSLDNYCATREMFGVKVFVVRGYVVS